MEVRAVVAQYVEVTDGGLIVVLEPVPMVLA
jgi:hypothetical protein